MMALSEKLIAAGYAVLYYVPDKTNWPDHISTISTITRDLQNNAIVVYYGFRFDILFGKADYMDSKKTGSCR